MALGACSRSPSPPERSRNVVLVTIDTLRADHVGAYGYRRARTATLDALAAKGVLFERAYSAAPITLTSHATMMTGRYPPGHGARDNGMRVNTTVPTLATTLKANGFATAAFVAAFPLDHQFGLDRGFDVYSDRMPRGPDDKLMNERPAAQVVDEALSWLRDHRPPATDHRPFFLWVHVFEPHAPYGDPSSGRPAIDRYDDEIGTADREIGRLVSALDPLASQTVIIVAGDHGEAFGEHGEYSHSIFVYDTTLRVPLLISAPTVGAARVAEPVTLADVAPTAAKLVGQTMIDTDGIDLGPAWRVGALPHRELYAESFASFLEFGWAPLRSIRSDRWKFTAAPRPELFDVDADPAEQINRVATDRDTARQLEVRVSRYSPPEAASARGIDASGLDRLRALGYASQSAQDNRQSAMSRPDPKDRRDVAARIAQVTAGELSGDALIAALQSILSLDPTNGQAHLRLGYAYLQRDDCASAMPEFTAAMTSGLPSADAHLGLATCLGRKNDLAGAERALREAQRREPDNPVLIANVGILQASRGELKAAIESLRTALAKDPGLDEARFNLALAYAKSDRRNEAAQTAHDLLARLPPNAIHRAEVERLVKALQ